MVSACCQYQSARHISLWRHDSVTTSVSNIKFLYILLHCTSIIDPMNSYRIFVSEKKATDYMCALMHGNTGMSSVCKGTTKRKRNKRRHWMWRRRRQRAAHMSSPRCFIQSIISDVDKRRQCHQTRYEHTQSVKHPYICTTQLHAHTRMDICICVHHIVAHGNSFNFAVVTHFGLGSNGFPNFPQSINWMIN